MEHGNQRFDASLNSIQESAPKIDVTLYDDKIKDCGSMSISKGEIRIKFDYELSQTNKTAGRELIIDSIAQALPMKEIRKCLIRLPPNQSKEESQ